VKELIRNETNEGFTKKIWNCEEKLRFANWYENLRESKERCEKENPIHRVAGQNHFGASLDFSDRNLAWESLRES